jgi:hypothetical protein
MRRISIDTLGMISPRGATFAVAKRRTSPWYLAKPRLLTTCFFFAFLYLWLQFGGKTVVIPDDSYALLEDESLKDILNTTLGVRWHILISSHVLSPCSFSVPGFLFVLHVGIHVSLFSVMSTCAVQYTSTYHKAALLFYIKSSKINIRKLFYCATNHT